MSELGMNAFAALPGRNTGAARLSVFFALWTLALVMVHDVRVNAAPIYDVSGAAQAWRLAPAPPPQIDSTSMWNAISQHSDVMSGRWSPALETDRQSPGRVTPLAVASDPAEARVKDVRPTRTAAGQIAMKSASDVAAAEALVAQRIAVRDFAGAIEVVDRVRAENPNASNQLRLLDAHLAIGQGDTERAYAILLESLPDIRMSPRQHDLLAAVMVRTSRYAEAAAVYRALLTFDPANARWWAGYAVTQQKLGNDTEMVAAFRALRTLAPPGTPLAAWAGERLQRIS